MLKHVENTIEITQSPMITLTPQIFVILRHGQAVAEEIKKWKMELDPGCTGKHWKKHPDLPNREAACLGIMGLGCGV